MNRFMGKNRLGRKLLPEEKRRKLITARVAPETYRFFKEQEAKLGLYLDQLVRKEVIGSFAKTEEDSNEASSEQIGFDPYDLITEHARGLLAMIVERGTSHLSQEQVEVLSENFATLVNNYCATFKKRA
ncbi:MAG: hypothetical protein JNN15_18965 [Blastocatellia bacterium]|nr:hypothetical protein [Blastocatellia bacterium]